MNEEKASPTSLNPTLSITVALYTLQGARTNSQSYSNIL